MLVLALLTSGCMTRGGAGPASRPAQAGTLRDDAVSTPDAIQLGGTYGADFVVAYESSCSRASSRTTYQGDLTLQIQPAGRARLDLRFEAHSVSGVRRGGRPLDRERFPAEHCRWEGEATRKDDALHLALSPSEGDRWACRSPVAVGAAGHELALTCSVHRRSPHLSDAARPRSSPNQRPSDLRDDLAMDVLTCAADQVVGQLLHDLMDPSGEQLHLSEGARLQIRNHVGATNDPTWSVR